MSSFELPVVRRRPRRLARELADALSEQVRSGVLGPGQKLPTESEIMLTHGVSRTVVREAISGLQSAGFVETRHGIGTFVLELPGAGDFRVEPTSMPTVREILDMLELRVSLESEAAGLAAARRTEGQLTDLRRILDKYQVALRSGGDTAEPDFEFHVGVAKATGNRYFSEVLAHFGTNTIPRTRVCLVQSPGGQAAYLSILSREHEEIYSAILRGDPVGAAQFMRAHLSNSRDRFMRAQDARDSL
ncbi:MAG: FadR/GntR family transcriptional regulator [Candidatus Solibacter sp.]